MVKALWNYTPELNVNNQILGSFQNNDNLYISENPSSHFEDNIDDNKLFEITNIKQECQDHQEQITELEYKNYLKYDSNFKNKKLIDRSDLSVKAEVYTSDVEAMSSNYVQDAVNMDLKVKSGNRSNGSTDVKLEDTVFFMDSFRVTRSNFESENYSSVMEMNLKTENNDPNIVKSASENETMEFINKKRDLTTGISELSTVNHKLEVEQGLQPIVLLKRLPNTIFNIGPQTSQITPKDFHLGLEENIFNDQFHSGQSDLPHKCPNIVCEKGFKTQYELGKHVISCRSVQSHKCDNRNQMTIQRTESPYQCNICEKEFKNMRGLRQHIICHSTERPHQCNVCEKGFKTIVEIRLHMIRHSTERPHQCNVCEKGFKTRADLRLHMTRHSTEKPHHCNVCEKGFKTIVELRLHMISHSTERPHQCNMCKKGFKNIRGLKQHMICHSTERPHQCNTCEKGFKTKDDLRYHMISHSTDRPHQCNICEKAFKTKDALKYHMIRHSTDRPHQCNICEKGFKTMADLRLHLTSHSTERLNKCDFCDKRFKTMNNVRQHLIFHSNKSAGAKVIQNTIKTLKSNACEEEELN